MATEQLEARHVALNDYQITLQPGGELQVTGPDQARATDIRHRFPQVMRSSQGQQLLSHLFSVGSQQQMEEAQETLIKLLGIPPAAPGRTIPATLRQKAQAKALGIQFPSYISRQALARQLGEFAKTRLYVELVWHTMTGRTTQACGIEAAAVQRLVRRLLANPDLMRRLDHARLVHRSATQEHDSIASLLDPGRSLNPADLANYVSLNRSDPLYLEMGMILKQTWARHVPGTLRSLLRKLWYGSAPVKDGASGTRV